MQNENNWKKILEDEFKKDYFKRMWSWLRSARTKVNIYPIEPEVFRAFELTPLSQVKVVILGQDPYHDGNADGLAFSCKKFATPSIMKIIDKIPGASTPKRGKPYPLDGWAKQGVLLLNTSLTVEEGFAGSHKDAGWLLFTGEILKTLLAYNSPKVFLIWGTSAVDLFSEATRIGAHDPNSNRALYCEHPVAASYRDREWNNSNCFRSANGILVTHNLTPIDWSRTNS